MPRASSAAMASATATRSATAVLLLLAPPLGGLVAADYTVLPGQRTAMFAGGCFWCMEEAFEKYAPGVVDAVSGYAGGSNDNPTYQDHGRYDETGHYEVVLVIYDPELATFASLLEYFWRNIDPTDGAGQFCDRGHAYAPAVFYEDADEQAAIQCSLAAVQSAHPSWGAVSESVEVRAKPRFWEGRATTRTTTRPEPSRTATTKTPAGGRRCCGSGGATASSSASTRERTRSQRRPAKPARRRSRETSRAGARTVTPPLLAIVAPACGSPQPRSAGASSRACCGCCCCWLAQR